VKIAIGSDHGGFELKQKLIERLKTSFEILDIGALKYNASDDYPDFAEALALAVSQKKADRGIVICGSGVGACLVVNKIPGVRASVCHDTYSAHQGVEHDDMNVICLGARVIGDELACEITISFLNARYSQEERHQRRLNKVLNIEKKYLKA
jgi:ribose 5-phosphate isomerase B